MQHLDPHQRPPDGIRNIYKKYQKMKLKELDQDQEIIDLSSDASAQSNSKVHVVKEWKGNDLTASFRSFAGQDEDLQDLNVPESVSAYEHEHMPGLYIVPTLLPPEIQSILLSRLLHRDLSNPAHLTNIHTHYTLSYPPPTTSFFSLAPDSPHPVAAPLDPSVHRPLTVAQLLGKKMRWTTLGGQYDWTAKRYPDAVPPPFPLDIKNLLESIFTSTKAEAAIVNLYSPGDTLSVHRDVAETSSTGLISISLGCDAVFVIGTDDTALTLRLRSGSAVYMSGASRFAWHGVPQIVPGTCPEYLQQWPGIAHGHEGYEAWKGWMASKRVNLNVRQMWD
ncbi:oxidoreductase [Pyrenochaeta sp. MPI-SDFR-AT-0127]|nr:oxidoreductase [Pyrenochaeta sp. MPI-SDFR-AT-0127]